MARNTTENPDDDYIYLNDETSQNEPKTDDLETELAQRNRSLIVDGTPSKEVLLRFHVDDTNESCDGYAHGDNLDTINKQLRTEVDSLRKQVQNLQDQVTNKSTVSGKASISPSIIGQQVGISPTMSGQRKCISPTKGRQRGCMGNPGVNNDHFNFQGFLNAENPVNSGHRNDQPVGHMRRPGVQWLPSMHEVPISSTSDVRTGPVFGQGSAFDQGSVFDQNALNLHGSAFTQGSFFDQNTQVKEPIFGQRSVFDQGSGFDRNTNQSLRRSITIDQMNRSLARSSEKEPNGFSRITTTESQGNMLPHNMANNDNERRYSAPAPKARKPALFDGTTNWQDYIVHFDMVAEINRWDDVTKAMELATNLRGTAQGVLSDLRPDLRYSFAHLVAALTARFQPENQAELYRAQIKGRNRKKNETISELSQDIKRLVRLAYPTASDDIREQLARDCFVDSLSDVDMEWAVYQGKPKTVDDAVRLAVEYEAFQQARNRQGFSRNSTRMQHLDQNQDNSSDQNVEREKSRGSFSTNRDMCHYCSRKGHWKKDCKIRKRDMENRNRQDYGGYGRQGNGRYYAGANSGNLH